MLTQTQDDEIPDTIPGGHNLGNNLNKINLKLKNLQDVGRFLKYLLCANIWDASNNVSGLEYPIVNFNALPLIVPTANSVI